jgi:hypothetical protein
MKYARGSSGGVAPRFSPPPGDLWEHRHAPVDAPAMRSRTGPLTQALGPSFGDRLEVSSRVHARVSTTTAHTLVAAAIIPMVTGTAWLALTSEHLEATVYFCCFECLQNAAKNAGPGASVVILLGEHKGRVRYWWRTTVPGLIRQPSSAEPASPTSQTGWRPSGHAPHRRPPPTQNPHHRRASRSGADPPRPGHHWPWNCLTQRARANGMPTRSRSRLNASVSQITPHALAPDDARSSGSAPSSRPRYARSDRVRPAHTCAQV